MKRIIVFAVFFLLATTAGATEHKPYTRNVAIVVYENAEPLDWTGPFEVYNDAGAFGTINDQPAFNVYIVSKTTEPLNAQGLKVVPNYSIANAPKPDIVVFPGGPATRYINNDPEFFAWAKQASIDAEVAQSVCTGAFVLAKAGLLDNLEVTTFHGAIEGLRKGYPNARVEDGRRFVDNGHVVTTAGISAGIDGSLNVVARLLGRRLADQVATYMEYHWTPEAYLSTRYAYLNPSTDDFGRALQTADIQRDGKDYAGATKTLRAVVSEQPANRDAWYLLAQSLRDTNDHLAAAQAFVKAGEDPKVSGAENALFEGAREFAIAQKNDDAIATLQRAFAAGFKNRDAVKSDPALAKLNEDSRVKTLVAATN